MATTRIDDNRLARLEGRVDELSVGIQDLRTGQREINGRIDQMFREINGRVDRLFLGMMAVGATLIGLVITLVVRGA